MNIFSKLPLLQDREFVIRLSTWKSQKKKKLFKKLKLAFQFKQQES